MTSRHLTAMFTDLAAGTTPTGQRRSAATLQRVRATSRVAYNAAIRERMVRDNPPRRVEMPTVRRPDAVVWTDSRVEQWEVEGHRPPVAVSKTAQLTEFLSPVDDDDPLFPLRWLVALRGLRTRRSRRAALGGRRPRPPATVHRQPAHHRRVQRRRRTTEVRG